MQFNYDSSGIFTPLSSNHYVNDASHAFWDQTRSHYNDVAVSTTFVPGDFNGDGGLRGRTVVLRKNKGELTVRYYLSNGSSGLISGLYTYDDGTNGIGHLPTKTEQAKHFGLDEVMNYAGSGAIWANNYDSNSNRPQFISKASYAINPARQLTHINDARGEHIDHTLDMAKDLTGDNIFEKIGKKYATWNYRYSNISSPIALPFVFHRLSDLLFTTSLITLIYISLYYLKKDLMNVQAF